MYSSYWEQKRKFVQKQLGKSVLRLADDFLTKQEQFKTELIKPNLMGIKNTPHIKEEWIDLLKKSFTHHTIDTMAYQGRAIDVELLNPLTLRAMTGSSSGTAINVLLGINDLGVGTDGGGSVIYPAMAVNIYSVMLAGLGFVSDTSKKSTDGISFMPSMGLMSFHKEILTQALTLLDPTIQPSPPKKIAGDKESLTFFQKKGDLVIFPESTDREVLIDFMKTLFNSYDIVLIKENQIDVHGYGDSVLGTTSDFFVEQQNSSGKKIGKVLNMIQASAFTVPAQEAASGYIIAAKNGKDAFSGAWYLFQEIKEQRTKLFMSYFGDHA